MKVKACAIATVVVPNEKGELELVPGGATTLEVGTLYEQKFPEENERI